MGFPGDLGNPVNVAGGQWAERVAGGTPPPLRVSPYPPLLSVFFSPFPPPYTLSSFSYPDTMRAL